MQTTPWCFSVLQPPAIQNLRPQCPNNPGTPKPLCPHSDPPFLHCNPSEHAATKIGFSLRPPKMETNSSKCRWTYTHSRQNFPLFSQMEIWLPFLMMIPSPSVSFKKLDHAQWRRMQRSSLAIGGLLVLGTWNLSGCAAPAKPLSLSLSPCVRALMTMMCVCGWGDLEGDLYIQFSGLIEGYLDLIHVSILASPLLFYVIAARSSSTRSGWQEKAKRRIKD